ncbi:hypothetical protein [Micromonospora narathiwatensis]|uniref:Uncharacterized protein n=1 Tax=Micromonospora narathiwatensis TaxID=299146 RepID=A0A1A8ZF23_9ACTN|nr:hypothetical protein [Micromonospora narathiwatensis]SBT42436.1 hypothetical protein GA0070621_1510 [Micromonospora narathiwatensis]
MNFRRPDRPADRAESERLLDAARAGRAPSPGVDPLARLLAAATAPADSTELRGEEQALAAFRAARVNPPARPARAPRRGRFRVGVAAWAAGLTAVATAGVAVAAVNLDRSGVPSPPPASTTAGGATAGSTGTGSSTMPAQTREASPTTGAATPSAEPDPTGSADAGRPAQPGNLAGHCRAYLSKSAKQRARALETPGFADLVTAAGGADQVEAYCLRLVPEATGHPSSNANPTRSAQGKAKASPAKDTGKPDDG